MGGFIAFILTIIGLITIGRWIYKKKNERDAFNSFRDLKELKLLLDEGAITQEEFKEQKERLFKEREEISKAKSNGCAWAIGFIVFTILLIIILIIRAEIIR
ncbi:hypothetical protein EDL98_05800 [Ornithobacterium rhinotracheale]|uniref:SHOCT domain-containing protein n=1 Tax=Ornithobacterium rhinotracheale TaxID=28251 RepID=UPI00129CFFC9|nr:hypothetical protein [Ornithobacterium rhinotracheale]MRJ08097.1 hypothetical protein [Ornithobacterium rhinotracheale]MRJ10596.1 hypothetical protein [Ornithobacterium rhinotracheale]UOH78396.1 hypothetical protein MT996_02750 [Ornithobacterium rhinotracheale]